MDINIQTGIKEFKGRSRRAPTLCSGCGFYGALGGFALAYNSRTASDTRSELGVRLDHLTSFDDMPLTLRGRVAWAHDWVSDPAMSAVFLALPAANFTVFGAVPAKNSALTSAGAELRVTPALSVAAKFDGQLAGGTQTYAGSGTVRLRW